MSHMDVDQALCRGCCFHHYVEDCLQAWVDSVDHPNRNGAIIALASMVCDMELEIELGPEVLQVMKANDIPLQRSVAVGWA